MSNKYIVLANAGILFIAVSWGLNFSVIKWALSDITPLYYLTMRFLLSGILLSLIHIYATDPDDVARAAEGVDVVVDMVMPWMATYVMKGALKAKANYINTAFDDPYCCLLYTSRCV